MKEEKIIMFDSDEATKQVTRVCWLSSNGILFFDEQSARYSGCTHIKCRECGVPAPKGYLICNDCREKADTAKWLKKEEKEWDGNTMLYSVSHDKFFNDSGELEDFFDDEEYEHGEKPSLESLRLVICEKQMYYTINPYDYYADNLPEDTEPCDEIEEAFEGLNDKIMACKTPICWEPGEFRPTTASVLKELRCGE